jgi:hypothetical protein
MLLLLDVVPTLVVDVTVVVVVVVVDVVVVVAAFVQHVSRRTPKGTPAPFAPRCCCCCRFGRSGWWQSLGGVIPVHSSSPLHTPALALMPCSISSREFKYTDARGNRQTNEGTNECKMSDPHDVSSSPTHTYVLPCTKSFISIAAYTIRIYTYIHIQCSTRTSSWLNRATSSADAA